MSKKKARPTVLLLNPITCGTWKDGGIRYKVDHTTGRRLKGIDNELDEHVQSFLGGERPPGSVEVPVDDVFRKGILVPRYYDDRWLEDFRAFLAREGLRSVSLGELSDAGIISVGSGHGSPGNDIRGGHIPYIKVSDVRSLRVNVNPTNLVSRGVAEYFWGGPESGLQGWDLITPNRASSNIGEFALLLPGEEERVLTKEFFVIRVTGGEREGWDWAYLLWAFCLKCVRRQWQRVALMQTNREDVGDRWREILLPVPENRNWAIRVSTPFRDYFTTLAEGRLRFLEQIEASGSEFIASVRSQAAVIPVEEETREAEAKG